MQAISGIYSITLAPTGRQYVGASVDILPRYTRHLSLLRQGTHPNALMQDDWALHGEGSCSLQVLERVPEIVQLAGAENRWIARLAPFYNAGRPAQGHARRQPRLMGIYAITHMATGERYIGFSRKMLHRLGQHRGALRHGRSGHRALQRAWTLYGEAAFALEVLEVVEREEELEEAEQRWLDKTPLLFNRSRLAGRPRGYQHDEESRRHMSTGQRAAMTAERRAHMAAGQSNRSAQTRRAMSEAGTRRMADPEVRRAMSEKLKQWHRTPEGQRQHSEAQTARWAREDERQRQSERQRGRKQSREVVAKRVATVQARRGQANARNKSSGIQGIVWDKRRQRWYVNLTEGGRARSFGYSRTLEEAQAALDAYCREHGPE